MRDRILCVPSSCKALPNRGFSRKLPILIPLRSFAASAAFAVAFAFDLLCAPLCPLWLSFSCRLSSRVLYRLAPFLIRVHSRVFAAKWFLISVHQRESAVKKLFLRITNLKFLRFLRRFFPSFFPLRSFAAFAAFASSAVGFGVGFSSCSAACPRGECRRVSSVLLSMKFFSCREEFYRCQELPSSVFRSLPSRRMPKGVLCGSALDFSFGLLRVSVSPWWVLGFCLWLPYAAVRGVA